MSTAPTTLFGMVPLVRAIVRSSASATTTTVTADDSGTMFVNMSTSAHTYAMPAVALSKGKTYIFFNGNGSNPITVTSTAANFMIDDATAASCVSSTDAIGDCIMVICDGTNYYGLAISGLYTNT